MFWKRSVIRFVFKEILFCLTGLWQVKNISHYLLSKFKKWQTQNIKFFQALMRKIHRVNWEIRGYKSIKISLKNQSEKKVQYQEQGKFITEKSVYNLLLFYIKNKLCKKL
jgi:hypothetical protein